MRFQIKNLLKATLSALALGFPISRTQANAQTYPIDCAILLCLSGGWPASVPCARARAEFVRRITPWPVEPPLQIWRCPMGTSFEGPAMPRPTDRADIDISGPEFNFLRSIRLFDVRQAWQRQSGEEGSCYRSTSVFLGSYETQGNFSWRSSSLAALPDAHVGLEGWGEDCPGITHRSVFVEWRDYSGNYGFEQVNY